MAKNFVSPGFQFEVEAPADVTSGSVVIVGNLCGVALTTAASGAPVTIATYGIFTLPKATTEEIDAGELIQIVDGKATAVGGPTEINIGVAVADAAETATTVKVLVYQGA